MATKKFAGPTPYSFSPSYPKVDYVFTEYVLFFTGHTYFKNVENPNHFYYLGT